jgi:hypothetical protein
MTDREELCEDCPPGGYPTEEPRCSECPRRRVSEEIMALRLILGEALAKHARKVLPS